MTQKKSLWAVLFVMLLMALSVNGAVAEDDVLRSGDYRYRVLEDGTAEITWYPGKDEILNIPGTLDGKKVTSIGDEAFAASGALIITIPDGVKKIGKMAFAGCEATEITMPDTVTSIGDWAFSECFYLEHITLSNNLVSIGRTPFLWSPSLESITIPDSVTYMEGNPFMVSGDPWIDVKVSPEHPTFAVIDDVVFNKVERSVISYPNKKIMDVYEIPQVIATIKNGTDSEDITLTTIGEAAFIGCGTMSIIIPEGVTRIERNAFAMTGYLDITIPESVTYIADDAFEDGYFDTLIVSRDSYAEQYAKEQNLNYTYSDGVAE